MEAKVQGIRKEGEIREGAKHNLHPEKQETDNTVSELIWQDEEVTHNFESGEAVGEGGKALGG